MNKPSFSVVIIMKNEAKVISRLAESLKEFLVRGGEWLCVDTGSDDGTPEIAEKLGAKVIRMGKTFQRMIFPKECKEINEKFIVEGENPVVEAGDTLFDFSSARNYAAGEASNLWVFMPDADEVYTKFDIDALEAIISNPDVHRLEYDFVFSHDQFGNPAVQFMHSKVYRKDKFEWKGIIHEVLQPTRKAAGVANSQYVGPEIIKLEHFQNHETNRTGYLRGLALDCFENPDNDRNSHYFGRELYYTGRYKSSIKEFERHVAMKKWPTEAAQSLIYIGDCWKELGDESKAVQAYLDSHALEGGRREALLRLAWLFHTKNEHKEVIKYAEQALTIPWSSFYANRASNYTTEPHHLLYHAYYWSGNKEKGKEHFEKCLEFEPLNSKYLYDVRFFRDLPKISIILPTLGREEGLQKCINSIKKLNYPHELEILVYDGDETVPEKVAKGYKEATGEVLCYAANDMEFTPDSMILAVLELDKKGLVAFHEGPLLPDQGNICTHFIIKRSLVEQIGGEIFDTRFNHCGVDNLLWAKCKKLGQAVHHDNAVIIHNHFSKGNAYDWVYQKGWDTEKVQHDRKLLKEELEKLNQQ